MSSKVADKFTTLFANKSPRSDVNNERQNSSNIALEETISTIDNTNIVGDVMWPIIVFLKVCGNSPLTYEKLNTETLHEQDSVRGNIEEAKRGSVQATFGYKIRLWSFCLLWSVFVAIGILYGWTQYIKKFVTTLHGGEDVDGSTAKNIWKEVLENQAKTDHPFPKSVTVTVTTTFYLIVIIHCLELVLSWIESSSLAQFLNTWAILQKQLQSIFPNFALLSDWYTSLKRSRNILLSIYVAIPTILFGIACIALSDLQNPSFIIALFPCALQVSTVTLLEDAKVIMTYKILAETFVQIRNGMQYSLKREGLSAGKMQSVRKLVHCVRLQVEQAGETQKNHQLFLLGSAIVLITCSVFILSQTPWGAPHTPLLALVGFLYVALQTGRLYIKIMAASRIPQKEDLIASDLLLMSANENEISIQLEIKLFHDMIIINPSVISFGSYVSLNKSLLLGVGSQVVTYLIVLMQFTN